MLRDVAQPPAGVNMMRVVYIAHPLGADPLQREVNRARAARWVMWAAICGVAPVADWIILSGQEDDSFRDRGLAIDVALVARCDEIWLCGGRVSPGMAIERDAAIAAGVRVVDLTALGEEPPSGEFAEGGRALLDRARA